MIRVNSSTMLGMLNFQSAAINPMIDEGYADTRAHNSKVKQERFLIIKPAGKPAAARIGRPTLG
jgi:aconitase B